MPQHKSQIHPLQPQKGTLLFNKFFAVIESNLDIFLLQYKDRFDLISFWVLKYEISREIKENLFKQNMTLQ